MRSSFTGLTTSRPVNTPGLLALGVGALLDRLGERLLHVLLHLAARARVPATSRSRSGCSGASTKNVAPNSVSGRVVKTGKSISGSSQWKTTSAPSERPIQLRCIVITRCGQDSSSLKSSSRRSA